MRKHRIARLVRLTIVVAISSLPLVAQADPHAARNWGGKCAGCHGSDGKGKTAEGAKMAIGDLSSRAWQKRFTDAQITAAIENGVSSGAKSMEGYKGKLPPEQIAGLVQLIRGLAK